MSRRRSRSPMQETRMGGFKSRFVRPGENRDCARRDILECSRISLIGDPVMMGSGTFGIFFNVEYTERHTTKIMGMKVVIRILNKSESTLEDYYEMQKEVGYSAMMGELDIGPKINDAFFYEFEVSELSTYRILNGLINIITNTNPNMHAIQRLQQANPDDIMKVQFMLMDKYEMSCHQALTSSTIDIDTKIQIVRKMVLLLQHQIEEGLYCNDIKPGNFVVNLNPLDVKMIDFGADFCKENNIYNGVGDNVLVSPLNISSPKILYISNVIQLLASIQKSGFFQNITLVKADDFIFNMFTNPDRVGGLISGIGANIFINHFFNRNWENFIDLYVDHAVKNITNRKNDPSNNLVWYSKPPNVTSNAQLYNPQVIQEVKDYLKNLLKTSLVNLRRRVP